MEDLDSWNLVNSDGSFQVHPASSHCPSVIEPEPIKLVEKKLNPNPRTDESFKKANLVSSVNLKKAEYNDDEYNDDGCDGRGRKIMRLSLLIMAMFFAFGLLTLVLTTGFRANPAFDCFSQRKILTEEVVQLKQLLKSLEADNRQLNAEIARLSTKHLSLHKTHEFSNKTHETQPFAFRNKYIKFPEMVYPIECSSEPQYLNKSFNVELPSYTNAQMPWQYSFLFNSTSDSLYSQVQLSKQSFSSMPDNHFSSPYFPCFRAAEKCESPLESVKSANDSFHQSFWRKFYSWLISSPHLYAFPFTGYLKILERGLSKQNLQFKDHHEEGCSVRSVKCASKVFCDYQHCMKLDRQLQLAPTREMVIVPYQRFITI